MIMYHLVCIYHVLDCQRISEHVKMQAQWINVPKIPKLVSSDARIIKIYYLKITNLRVIKYSLTLQF